MAKINYTQMYTKFSDEQLDEVETPRQQKLSPRHKSSRGGQLDTLLANEVHESPRQPAVVRSTKLRNSAGTSKQQRKFGWL